MSVLSNTDLINAITNSNCDNSKNVNETTFENMDEGEAIFVVAVGTGGVGIAGTLEADVAETLEQISETDANVVNSRIKSNYKIISENGYPG